MSDRKEQRAAQFERATASPTPVPPEPPRSDLNGQAAKTPNKSVYLPDPIAVRDLASALGLKPFKVVADLMKMHLLKSPDDLVDFQTASFVARQNGYQAEKPPLGTLVL
jgi:translation initiation factor IF-2